MSRLPRRVLGYARVSSVLQAQGDSLPNQQAVIRSHTEKRGLKVEAVMFVEAESAVHEKFERREQIQALMATVRAGDLVLVDKIDRWSRDPEFTYASVRQIHEKGASFYAIGDDCDPSTPQGDSMLGLRIFFAREEHKRIRERTVGMRKALRDRGYYVEGLPPWGYARQDVRKNVRRNELVVVEADAAKVREMFTRCVAGDSIDEITKALGVNRDRVAKGLHCRTYLGESKTSSGEWIKGPHPAIVTPQLFAEAQLALVRRKHGSRRPRSGAETSTWWLRELARCGLCGAKLSAAYAGPLEARRYYFRCYAKCTSRFVRVADAEYEVELLVFERLLELRTEIVECGEAKTRAPVVDVTERLEQLARRRLRYAEAYADGAIDREELRAKLVRLDEERERLVAKTKSSEPVPAAKLAAALRDVKWMGRAFEKAEPEERRRIVGAIASAVFLAAGKEARVEWVSAEALARRA